MRKILILILIIILIDLSLPQKIADSNTLFVNDEGKFQYKSALIGAYWPQKLLNYQYLRNNSHLDIVLTNTGFEPSVLVVHVGDTVTFKSERETDFWPASDPHPTHNGYPGFDAGHAIHPGSSWSFTFDKVGVWGYHDHLASSYSPDVGIVEVFDKDIDINNIEPISLFTNCGTSSYAIRCWANVLRNEMINRGLDSAFDLLKKMYKTEPTVSDNCNDITHYFGGLSYRFFKNKKEDIVIPKSLYCGGGFYHGFIEVWFHDKPKITEVNEFCNYVGNTLKDDKVLARQACFHGIGHGAYHLNLIGNWDDFANEVKKSFRVCETFPEIPNCINGVFVAAVTDYYQGRYILLNKKENPFRYCEALSEYKSDCYRGFISVYLRDSVNLDEITKSINSIREEVYRKEAIATVMHVYAIQNRTQRDKEKVLTVCRNFGETSLKDQCLSSYLRGLVDFGEPGREHTPDFNFCTLPDLTNQEVDFCRHNIIDYERDFLSKTQFKMYCESLSGVDKEYCVSRIEK